MPKVEFRNGQGFALILLTFALLTVTACNDARKPDGIDLPKAVDLSGQQVQSVALNDKAISSWHKGDFQTALHYISKSVENARKNGDEKEMARALNNQGLVNWSLENTEAALECYEEAGRIAERHDMFKLLGLTHTNRGLIYKARDNYGKALAHNDKAIEIFREFKHFHELAIALNNQGQIYKRRRQTALARSFYLEAIENYRKENYLDGMGATYYNLAEIDKQENARSGALKNVTESIRLSTAAKNRVQINDAYKLLAEIYEHFNQKDSALKYYKIYTDLNTRQLLANQSDKIASYQAELGAEVKNLKIANLQKEQELSRSRLWLVGILSVAVMLAGLFAGYRYLLKMRHRRQCIEMELENFENISRIREQELRDYILDLSEKSRTINKMQDQLQQNTVMMRDDSFSQLLEQKILTDDDWVIFKQKFKNIYPVFFARIKQSAVALTEAEIRIIMLMCLNLSGKEMAATLGISDQSARVGKLRLKKKLQQQGFQDIAEFIPLLIK